jgi:subtilase family serine protease
MPHSTRTTRQLHRRSFYYWRLCRFEPLELRQLLTAATDAQSALLNPMYELLPSASPTTPTGFTAAQMQQAYGTNQISFTKRNTNGTTTVYSAANNNLGAGMTIAIVDAYNDPNILGDAAVFSAAFGLPQFNQAGGPTLKVVNQNGASILPGLDPNNRWPGEIALDVEWAHAIAPGANILLVEATNNSDLNLNAAVNYARRQPGVVVVSNSYGGPESPTDRSNDSVFTTPSGHSPVSFTVSAGDDGGPAEYPSASPNVLSVGGTSLSLSKTNAYANEAVWNNATGATGGGQSGFILTTLTVLSPTQTLVNETLSPVEPVPSYQAGLGLKSRGTPDVSYNADPLTGVAVYESFVDGGWTVFGGTSAGAPQWAALIAIADQGRALQGKPALANVQSIMYKLPASDFHDITVGNNDLEGLGLGLSGNQAKVGYDLASGRGTPITNLVVRDLVAYNGTTTFNLGPISSGPLATGQFIKITPPTTTTSSSKSMTYLPLGGELPSSQLSTVAQLAADDIASTTSDQINAPTRQTDYETPVTTESFHSDIALQQFGSDSQDDLLLSHSHSAAFVEDVTTATDKFFSQV